LFVVVLSKLIVSLTFDDGLDCHLDLVVPMLEERGLLGTFFIHLRSRSFGRRFNDWKNAAHNGHEIGNHTIFHPDFSSKGYVSNGNDLETYTLDRMRLELEVANQLLYAVDRKNERSFSYPCSNTVLGSPGVIRGLLKRVGLDKTRVEGWLNRFPLLDNIGSEKKDYSCLVPDYFIAARGAGFGTRSINVELTDRYAVPCMDGDNANGQQLCETVEKFKLNGNWLVFMFHAIGSGHVLCSETVGFEMLLDKLTADNEVHVLPFSQAAKILFDITL